MFKNALVGVDGSPFGRDAVALASRLLADGGTPDAGARPPRRACTRCTRSPPGSSDEEHAASEKLLLDERERAGVEAELHQRRRRLAGRGPCTSRPRSGGPTCWSWAPPTAACSDG